MTTKRIVDLLRRIPEWSYGVYAWIAGCAVLLLFGSIIALLCRPAYARPIARMAARLGFLLVGVRVSASGLHRLPDGLHVLVVNHTSFLDGIVLTALLPARPGYAFVVRQQYRSQALLWPLLRALGTIVLTSANPAHSASNVPLLEMALRCGENLLIFPEGRIVPEEGLGHFHSGAFVAAASEKVPVVVAGLHGARTALKLGTWLPRRAEIKLRIGAVLLPEGKDEDALSRLSHVAHAAMLPLTGEKDADC
jgi:1-acyl-sn-glycerol-3-phosphate acyltransferase